MYEMYRIVVYYRLLWWLIPIKKFPKMMAGKACYKFFEVLGYDSNIEKLNPIQYKDRFLKETFLLSGSRKYKFGKRVRLTVN